MPTSARARRQSPARSPISPVPPSAACWRPASAPPAPTQREQPKLDSRRRPELVRYAKVYSGRIVGTPPVLSLSVRPVMGVSLRVSGVTVVDPGFIRDRSGRERRRPVHSGPASPVTTTCPAGCQRLRATNPNRGAGRPSTGRQKRRPAASRQSDPSTMSSVSELSVSVSPYGAITGWGGGPRLRRGRTVHGGSALSGATRRIPVCQGFILRGHEKAGSVGRTIPAPSALALPMCKFCTSAGVGLTITGIIGSLTSRVFGTARGCDRADWSWRRAELVCNGIRCNAGAEDRADGGHRGVVPIRRRGGREALTP